MVQCRPSLVAAPQKEFVILDYEEPMDMGFLDDIPEFDFDIDCPLAGISDDKLIESLTGRTTEIAGELGVLEHLNDSKSLGHMAREVGDDLVCVASTLFNCTTLAVLEKIYHLEISWKDTAIRKDLIANFCESLIEIPKTPGQTFDFTRNLSEDPNFTDVPKMRLVVNSLSMRQKLSDTFVGKASYLGTRMSYAVGYAKTALDVLSCYQDVFLGSLSARQNAYLPVGLGGCGKPPLFSENRNIQEFNNSYKGGRYVPYFNTLMSELNSFARKKSIGMDIEPTVLLKHAGHAQNQFFDWIKTLTAYSPYLGRELPEECQEFKVKKHFPEEQALLNRLSDRGLVSQDKLTIMSGRDRLVTQLMSCKSWSESKSVLDERTKSLKSLTAAQMYSLDYCKRQFIDTRTHFDEKEVDEFVKNCKIFHGAYMKSLSPHDLYFPEVLDKLNKEQVFHINMEIGLNRDGWVETLESKLMHPEPFSLQEEKLYKEAVDYFRLTRAERRKTQVPGALVEDDEILIETFHRRKFEPHVGFVIISSDMKDVVKPLMLLKPWQTKCPIIWVPVRYYTAGYRKYIPKKPGFRWITLRDSGSISSEIRRNYDFPEAMPLNWPYIRLTAHANSHSKLFCIRDPSGIFKP